MRHPLLPYALTLAALTGACGPVSRSGASRAGSTAGSTAGGPGATGELTYYRDAKPIIDAKCGGCHVAGSFAPFTLTSYADVSGHLAEAMDAIDSGKMPPWAPDQACNTYRNARFLAPDELATLKAWAAAGGAAGSPTQAAPTALTATPALPRVDLSLQMSKPYTPQLTPDEYRCFLVDWPKTTDTFVTGYSVHPGNPAIVHHVVAFIAKPGDVAALQAKDGQDGHPGYPCFGSAGASSLSSAGNWLGIWAPGSVGTTYGDGTDTGLRISPGSKIILQVHYHLYGDPSAAAPDQTTLQLMTADAVAKEGFMIPFGNPVWLATKNGLTIPAGAVDAQASFTLQPFLEWLALNRTAPAQLAIYNAGMHMHQLGSAGSLVLTQGAQTQCIMDIKAWDFHWQDLYALQNKVVISRGDTMTVTCHWNNSAANQPLVAGVKQLPHDVHWGEASTDEMCLGLFYMAPE